MRLHWIKIVSSIGLACICGQPAFAFETVYQEPAEFLRENLPDCRQKALWLDKGIKARVESAIGHPFAGIRARYCEQDEKTGWILDEIGKTEPITTGIIVDRGQVQQVRVLVFRESRGAEVHRDVFTRQYHQAALEDDDDLDRRIDGITGATLSVAALNRQVKLALLLDQAVRSQADDD
jgi:hypothetical protein